MPHTHQSSLKTYTNVNKPILPSFISVQARNFTLLGYYSDLEILGVTQGPRILPPGHMIFKKMNNIFEKSTRLSNFQQKKQVKRTTYSKVINKRTQWPTNFGPCFWSFPSVLFQKSVLLYVQQTLEVFITNNCFGRILFVIPGLTLRQFEVFILK